MEASRSLRSGGGQRVSRADLARGDIDHGRHHLCHCWAGAPDLVAPAAGLFADRGPGRLRGPDTGSGTRGSIASWIRRAEPASRSPVGMRLALMGPRGHNARRCLTHVAMSYAPPAADGRRQRRSATNAVRRFRAGSAIRSGARAPTCSVAGTRSTSLAPRGPARSVLSRSPRIRRRGRLPLPPPAVVRASTTLPRPRMRRPNPHGPPSRASQSGLRPTLTSRLRGKPPQGKRLRRRRLPLWSLRRAVLRHGDGVELRRHPRRPRQPTSQPLRRLSFRRPHRPHIAPPSRRRPVAG